MVGPGIINSTDIELSKLRERVEDRGAWRSAVQEGFKESDMT